MTFPLSFLDVSIWLAITAIILLMTSEMLSPRYGKVTILIDRGKLKNAGIAVFLLFLVVITVQVVSIIFARI